MKVIGITGGVGSGKSVVLDLLSEMCKCVIIKSDNLAKSLEKKGEVCYEALVELLSDKILGDDGEIVPQKMAQAIFENKDASVLEKVNNIIHPEVKKRILSLIEEEKNKKEIDYFFIEAALLIEDHYDLICDELWYVYSDLDVRKNRLKESRGYSDEKIAGIISKQLDDDSFRKYCAKVINNSGSIENVKESLKHILNNM